MMTTSDAEVTGTFGLVVENAHDLGEESVFGDAMNVGGFPWRIIARTTNEGEPATKYISIYVNSNWETENENDAWECSADLILCLEPAEINGLPYERKCSNVFNQRNTVWGFKKFLKWDELVRRGYLRQNMRFVFRAEMVVNEYKSLSQTFLTADEVSNAILLVEEKKLYVSRELLSLSSPFFKTLFYSDFQERHQKEIPLPDVIADDFLELLRVVYPPHKKISESNIAVVLKLADRYRMDMVLGKCEDYLRGCTRLPLSKKLVLAETYNLKSLLKRMISTVKSLKDVKTLRGKRDFQKLSSETKIIILDKGVQVAKM